MTPFLATFTILFMLRFTLADVLHLDSHYWPAIMNQHNRYLSKGTPTPTYDKQKTHFETKIEKHQVYELPKQIEVKEGRSIYGIHSLSSNYNSNKNIPKIKFDLSTENEIENLQPPLAPPMRTYLPPVTTESKSIDMPSTTKSSLKEKADVKQLFATTGALPGNAKMAETLMPLISQNQYLPPLDIILPPFETASQLTYKKYREQFIDQKSRHKVTEIEQEEVQQPVAPVETDLFLREDGYRYKTTNEDLNCIQIVNY